MKTHSCILVYFVYACFFFIITNNKIIILKIDINIFYNLIIDHILQIYNIIFKLKNFFYYY